MVKPIENKVILALDTAAGGLGLALWREDGQGYVFMNENRQPSDRLHPALAGLMAENSIHFNEVGLIVTTRGPGSFTGVRIGLAAAQGLGLGLGVPVVAVSTLEAMVWPWLGRNKPVTVWLEAFGGLIYDQTFTPQGEPLTQAAALTPEQAAQRFHSEGLLCGDAVPLHRDAVPDAATLLEKTEGAKARHIDPLALAQLGLKRWRAGKGTDLAPIYLTELNYRKKGEASLP